MACKAWKVIQVEENLELSKKKKRERNIFYLQNHLLPKVTLKFLRFNKK